MRKQEQRALRPMEFFALLVLADERLHGYGLVKAIEERSDGRVRVRPGNLYRVLDRLIESGLVAEESAQGEPSQGKERTRLFVLTSRGRTVVADEARLLTDVIRGSKSLSRAVERGRGS